MRFIEDADGQLINVAQITRIWASEKVSGSWAVLADLNGATGVMCLRRGFGSKTAARDWMHLAIPGVLVIP